MSDANARRLELLAEKYGDSAWSDSKQAELDQLHETVSREYPRVTEHERAAVAKIHDRLQTISDAHEKIVAELAETCDES